MSGVLEPAALPTLPVEARFDHVALAVPRIVDTLPMYQDLLGGRFFTGGDNPRLGYRGVQLELPGGKVEILEPLEGSDFLDSFLASRPQGGLHHLTFVVADLRATTAEVERAGFPVHGEFTDDARWQEVFVHPKLANGVLVQFAQTGPGYGPDTFGMEQVLAGHGNHGNGRSSPGHRPGAAPTQRREAQT